MASELKRQYVASLFHRLSQHPNFVLLNFGRASHHDLEELRKKLHELAQGQSPNIAIIKNSLFRIAFQKYNKAHRVVTESQEESIIGEPLTGPSALLFMSENWMALLKSLYGFSKDRDDVTLKVGIIDGELYDGTSVTRLAQLPGFEELMAKVVSSMKSSQSRLSGALRYNTSKFVYVLRHIKN